MCICKIYSGVIFSKNYDNLYWKGYNLDFLIGRVEELLQEKRPDLIWYYETGEIAVEHTSLSQARLENPIEEIKGLMVELWETAKQDFRNKCSSERLALMDKVNKVHSVFEYDSILEEINNLDIQEGFEV